MDQRIAKRIFYIACFSYFTFGILNASIGPLLEQLAVRNNVALVSIGGIFSALFFGSFAAQLVIGPFTDRLGQHRVFAVSLIILAIFLAAMSLSRTYPLTLALAFVAGTGFGTAVLAGNVLIGQLFQSNSVPALNWVNVFFGLGDVVGPLLVSFSLITWNDGNPALWFGSLGMVISALLMILFFFKTKLDAVGQGKAENTHEHFRVSPFLLSLAGMIAIYVGSEAAIGGWTTTYLHSTTSLTIERAALATSGFWLALTLGRVMGAVLGSRISAVNLLKLCFGITMAGAIVYAASFGDEVWSIVAILIIGFGFGAIFPTIFSILTSSYKGASGKAATLLTASGSASGMLLPWLQGVIFDKFGMHSVSYMTVGLAALLWVAFAINRQVNKKNILLAQ